MVIFSLLLHNLYFRYVFYLKNKDFTTTTTIIIICIHPFTKCLDHTFLLPSNPYGALLNPLAKYPDHTLFVPLFLIGQFET